ncbi:MAG: hypothetical protein ACI4SK_06215 [Christensenellales bacterium]
MEENVVIAEEEFTFKKFFNLIKKSGKRILVYAIIFAIIGACLAAIVGVCTIDDKVYTTTVEYTHAGIEKGLAPDGNVLDYNLIKSSVVINAALKDMGYDDDTVSSLSAAVEDAITVAPYVSDAIAQKIAEDPTFEYTPTRYVIGIRNNSVKGIKSSAYATLLNKVVEKYRDYFKTTYKYEVEFTDVIGANALSTTTDYFDLIYLYDSQLNALRSSLRALPDSYATVNAKLMAKIDILDKYVSSLENYILTHNVQKQGAALSLIDNIANRKKECEIKSEAYANQITALTATIAAYNQQFETIIIGGSADKITVTGGDPAVYNSLVTKKDTIVSLQAECDRDAKILAQKSVLVPSTPCTDTDRAYVDQRFGEVYSYYSVAVADMNEELAQYTERYVMNNGVRTVSPASTAASMGWVAVFATLIVTVVVGIAAAIIVTSVKTKKKN